MDKNQRTSIQRDKIFVVEGSNDLVFLSSFIEKEFPDSRNKYNIEGISENSQIITLGGLKPISKQIGIVLRTSNFSIVRKMALIVDADDSLDSRLQGIQSGCRHNNIPIPTKIGEFYRAENCNFLFGTYIMNVHGKGMLETMCLSSIENDPVQSCLDQLWICIDKLEEDKIYIKPNNQEKARCLSFLSTRKEFSNTVGIAAKKGYWNFKHTIFDDLRQFIQKTLDG